MALEWLIHAEISSTLTLARVELENLEKTLVTTNGDITLLLVPSHSVHWSVYSNLFK